MNDDVPSAAEVAGYSAAERKVYTRRLRRMAAARQRLTLHVVGRKDRHALDYNRAWLSDAEGNTVASGYLWDMHAYLIRPR